MKKYELTVLVRPELEIDLDAPLDKVRKLIKDSGGEVLLEDSWGKKKLAYAIDKENFAVYVYFELNLPAEAPLKISNTLNITSEIMRYLLVKTDEKGRARLEEAKKKRANSEQSDSEDQDSKRER